MRCERRLLSRLMLYGIGLICLCVVMYMLGSTMTLWTMQFAAEQTDNVVLEGFSLPTTGTDINPAMPVTVARETAPHARQTLGEHDLLRPPNPTA